MPQNKQTNISVFLKRLATHKLIQGSFVVYAGSMISNVAAWLYHVIIGRIMGAERYGELAALLSLLYLINVPTGVLQTILVKFFSIFRARNADGQTKQLFIFITARLFAVLVGGGFVLFLFIPMLARFLHISEQWFFVFLYLIFASTIISVVNTSILQAYQKFLAVSVFSNFGIILRLLFSIPAAFIGVGWTLVANIASNLVSYVAMFVPMRFVFKISAKPVTLTRKEALTFSIPAFLATLGIIALFSQDVLLVKHYFSSFDAGIYSALSVLGKVVFYASSAVSFVLYPVIAERKERHVSHTSVVFGGLGFIGLMCALVTFLYIFYPQIVVLPFGPSYKNAQPYLGIFAVFISFFSLSSILMSILLALDAIKVWIFAILAAIVQACLIIEFHSSLYSIVYVNIGVAVGLFATLLLYYLYVSRKK